MWLCVVAAAVFLNISPPNTRGEGGATTSRVETYFEVAASNISPPGGSIVCRVEDHDGARWVSPGP